MNATVLLAEFLVIGIFPFLTVLFVLLLALGVEDLSFLESVQGHSAGTAIGISLAIYVLGAVTHRLTQFLNSERLPVLKRIPVLGRKLPLRTHATWPEFLQQYYLVLQYGSDGLIAKITYSESLARVFKACGVSAPILGLALGSWLGSRGEWLSGVLAVSLSLFFSAASIVAFVMQHSNHMEAIEHGWKLIAGNPGGPAGAGTPPNQSLHGTSGLPARRP